ncbi:MAG TPA: hypothetical protein VHW60_16495 [Caulobacteraceae bacterium]|jgi:hypothetical protein|nr:hypothetical protein [Caulobacteraceae bacterium]
MSGEEVFIGGVTRSWLRERSQNERYNVWKRAKALHSAEGNHLARAIELLGLPYAEPEPLPADDPLLERMRALIAEPRARAAAVEATLDGLPAMAGIDVLMHEELGEAYRRNEAAAPTAQQLTADLMTGLGYVAAGTKDLPARCVARSGVYWKRG